MKKSDFDQWRSDLMKLDRYEDAEDGKAFVALAGQARGNFDEDVIGVLLDTFCNEDDYGIQEAVLGILDDAEPEMYSKILARKFTSLLLNASEQEWPLLIIGRTMNSGDARRISAVVRAAADDKLHLSGGAMDNFIRSSFFTSEYPEIAPYL
ncbi:hypothetical protein FNU76_22495 [Chitinimonas arctica]|uniref:HEAT repeat domain-containing protein n=1 Tax=Chitinimonas arctica TaxID=2594795 RepID=A0A516SL55_9NEIS|nr:hypothetical protein [Chitinimonas arctica]QDQ28897.1 hypothetical protein FNU76_22495 [Chitinimonas arctica]